MMQAWIVRAIDFVLSFFFYFSSLDDFPFSPFIPSAKCSFLRRFFFSVFLSSFLRFVSYTKSRIPSGYLRLKRQIRYRRCSSMKK